MNRYGRPYWRCLDCGEKFRSFFKKCPDCQGYNCVEIDDD